MFAGGPPVWVAGLAAHSDNAGALEAAGARIIGIEGEAGRPGIAGVLRALAGEGITRLMVEARSGAKANAALLEAQALDIRALNVAQYPEILEYRYQLGVLDKLVEAAEKLPQVVNVGAGEANKIDYVAIARQMMGLKDDSLYTEADLAAIRGRLKEIAARVKERHQLIKEIEAADNAEVNMTLAPTIAEEVA